MRALSLEELAGEGRQGQQHQYPRFPTAYFLHFLSGRLPAQEMKQQRAIMWVLDQVQQQQQKPSIAVLFVVLASSFSRHVFRTSLFPFRESFVGWASCT